MMCWENVIPDCFARIFGTTREARHWNNASILLINTVALSLRNAVRECTPRGDSFSIFELIGSSVRPRKVASLPLEAAALKTCSHWRAVSAYNWQAWAVEEKHWALVIGSEAAHQGKIGREVALTYLGNSSRQDNEIGASNQTIRELKLKDRSLRFLFVCACHFISIESHGNTS